MFRRLWRVIDAHTSSLEKSNRQINKAEWKITDLVEIVREIIKMADYYTDDEKQPLLEKLDRNYTNDYLVNLLSKPVGFGEHIHSMPPTTFTGEEIELINEVSKAARDGSPISLLSARQRKLLANIIRLCSPSITFTDGPEGKR